jgi:predicted esterase
MMTNIKRHFSALMKAYELKDYSAGLRISEQARKECPEEAVQTRFWQACMHSLIGNAGEAVAALRAGLREGAWWSPSQLDQEHDFDAIRGTPGFSDIGTECERRFRERQAASEPLFMTIEPETGIDAERCLIAIHWRGGSAKEFAEYWEPLAEDRGWTLVFPQSSQVYSSTGYCWDDVALAKKELMKCVASLEAQYGIRRERLIVAGASQGARVAFEIALEIGAPYFCVIPSFPEGYDESVRAGKQGRGKSYFVLGERDELNRRSQPVIDALKECGAPPDVRVMKGVGHDLPEGFAALISGDLEELLARR